MSDYSSSSSSPDALRKADFVNKMLVLDHDAPSAAVAMMAAAAGISAAAPTSADVQQVECTDRAKHFSCIGTTILGDSCSKRIVRNFKKHGRGVVCASCDTNKVWCETKECKSVVHKGCYVQLSDGTRVQPTYPWTCPSCSTAKAPETSNHLPETSDQFPETSSNNCQTSDEKDEKQKCLIIPFSTEASLIAAISDHGLSCRSSRKNVDGSETKYYYCNTCSGLASSRYTEPNWILSLPQQHETCKKPAIGVVDYQKGLPSQVLQHIRELSSSNSLSGQQIQELVKFHQSVSVSVDLIYRIGIAVRRKLYGSSGDHGHLLRLQEERRVGLP